MSDFTKFSKAVEKKFSKMSEGELFIMDIDSDKLYETYLEAFPEGTNPIFRERTQHDCSCCRNFIKNIGSVVSIVDDKIVTVWDIDCGDVLYDAVSKTMAGFVKLHTIRDRYFTKEAKYGNEFNLELLEDNTTRKWEHFVGHVPLVHRKNSPAEAMSEARSEFRVFKRGLKEMSFEALDTVIDLIDSKSIYRGEEHIGLVKSFKEMKTVFSEFTPDVILPDAPEEKTLGSVRAYAGEVMRSLDNGIEFYGAVNNAIEDAGISELVFLKENEVEEAFKIIQDVLGSFVSTQQESYAKDADLFIWRNTGKGGVNRFRNTVIGTLVTDLSNGVPLEDAVKMFESKVAPVNYKRPKALITPKMIEQAMGAIKELGLEPALERRHARFSDISVNDVLFVDNAVKPQMIGGLEGDLLSTVKSKAVKVKNAINITPDEFIGNVLPKAHEVEVLVKNKNLPSLVSLTAPVKSDVENLFKWDNNFAWSYEGNVADSDIKTRVKAAGGNVDALFRVSLGWFNTDDLDIHVRTPSGEHVSYSNKAGILDVDMNASGNHVRDAVENTCWGENNLRDGKYVFSVHNYAKRESIDVGFSLELDFAGSVETFSYPKPVSGTIQCLEVVIKDKCLVSVAKLNKDITSESASQNKWGVETEVFTAASSIVLSPNHWGDNKAGNKHLFFLLKGCKNPDPVRGIYNEFLNPGLDKHRKVFEIIGDKTKCLPSEDQMSGIGISSTKKDELLVKVKSDKTQQIYNIKF